MNVNIKDLLIFKVEYSSALHIEFSCEKLGKDNTWDVFNSLKEFSLNATDTTSQWYEISPSLLLTYNKDKKRIEFKENESSTQEPGSALKLLPSLLLRDWHVIDSTEKELLESYLQYHPLIQNSADGNMSLSSKKW